MTNSPKPSLEWELRLGYPLRIIAGVDEVGRGCLAGPVVAGALVLPESVDFEAFPWLSKITDSKELSAKTREELEPKILSWARAVSIGTASVEEIDQVNIYHATHLAMLRAAQALKVPAEHFIIDGNVVPAALRGRATAVVKGDRRSLSVAAASIIAKVWRDRLMGELEREYPGYGLAVHKGYGTATHRSALLKLGPTPLHRRSFAPIAALFAAETQKNAP